MSNNNENKLVPKLRFPEFKDGWKIVKLRDVSSYFNGGSYENDVKEEGKYELITLKSINTNGKLVNSKRYIDIEAPTLKKGTLIMILSEQAPGLLGMTAIIPSDNKYVLNQRVAEIRPSQKVESYFLSMAINRNQNYFSKQGAGMKVQNISKPNVEKYEFSLPEILEQKKIASCFSSLDEIITTESEKLDLLKDYKKGLLQNLLPHGGETVPKFRFKEFEDSGDWEETTLTQVADYENGKAHEQDIADDGKFIVVNSKFISQDGEVKKFTNTAFLPATKGDVLMVLSDIPNGKAIAKCFLVEEDNRYTVNQRICRITPRNVNSKILYYLLNRNPYFLAFDDGVKQTNLRKDDVLNCPLLIPEDPKEQDKIADTLSSVDDLINAQNQKMEALQLHKKGLLQGLFPNLNEVTE
jgi:type I restriction enzyme, S subunit